MRSAALRASDTLVGELEQVFQVDCAGSLNRFISMVT